MNTYLIVFTLALFGILGFAIYRLMLRIGYSRDQWQKVKSERKELTKREIHNWAGTLASPMFWIAILTFLVWKFQNPTPAEAYAPGSDPDPLRDLSGLVIAGLAAGTAYVIRGWYRWSNVEPRPSLTEVARKNWLSFGIAALIALFFLYRLLGSVYKVMELGFGGIAG